MGTRESNASSQCSLRNAVHSYMNSQTAQEGTEACLGAPPDADTPEPDEVSEGEPENRDIHSGRGKRPLPTDFKRIAPGLYRFRDDRLVEFWVEKGQPMVKDHGCHPKLTRKGREDIEWDSEDEDEAREHFGIKRAHGEGEGVPLASFLCRQ